MGEYVKAYKTYEEQVEILAGRGMVIGDPVLAMETLRKVNYYRLSGYWYPFRQISGQKRGDKFYPGTSFADVVALYEFDERLRAATFAALMPVELAIRALLGYGLGRIDPLVHLDPLNLGPTARGNGSYERWVSKYQAELQQSREDFVAHHHEKYGGVLPVWAAVEVLDWGSLTYLYGFSPRPVQDSLAKACGLSAPQLSSWLKSLNIVRNICAHNGRLFNRVHTITPKLPKVGLHPDLDSATTEWNRTFGQLTMIQFLTDRLGLKRSRLLPAVVKSYPEVQAVPLSHMGVTEEWQSASSLWPIG